MKLKVTHDTYFKPSADQASLLPPEEVVFIEKGREFDVHSYIQDRDGHIRVALLNTKLGSKGKNTWVVFGRHLEIDGVSISKFPFKLNVPYFSQRDNAVQPWRTCNTSSHAMLVAFLKPGAIAGDDGYFRRFVQPYGDSTDHGVHTRALSQLGIKSEWRTNLNYADIDRQLERGFPVPIGVLHNGTIAAPSGGHILVVIGRQDENSYICNDPWGAGFSYTNHNGREVIYPKQSLNRRWLVTGPGSGWGRIVFG